MQARRSPKRPLMDTTNGEGQQHPCRADPSPEGSKACHRGLHRSISQFELSASSARQQTGHCLLAFRYLAGAFRRPRRRRVAALVASCLTPPTRRGSRSYSPLFSNINHFARSTSPPDKGWPGLVYFLCPPTATATLQRPIPVPVSGDRDCDRDCDLDVIIPAPVCNSSLRLSHSQLSFSNSLLQQFFMTA